MDAREVFLTHLVLPSVGEGSGVGGFFAEGARLLGGFTTTTTPPACRMCGVSLVCAQQHQRTRSRCDQSVAPSPRSQRCSCCFGGGCASACPSSSPAGTRWLRLACAICSLFGGLEVVGRNGSRQPTCEDAPKASSTNRWGQLTPGLWTAQPEVGSK